MYVADSYRIKVYQHESFDREGAREPPAGKNPKPFLEKTPNVAVAGLGVDSSSTPPPCACSAETFHTGSLEYRACKAVTTSV